MPSSVAALIAAALRGELDEAQARQLYACGPEAVVLALLGSARRIAEQEARLAALQAEPRGTTPSPGTPSGLVPVHTKPNAGGGRRRKRPGARPGHPGTRRPAPEQIDRRQVHRLKRCPHCDGPLQRCRQTRSRLIEDLLDQLRVLITEHVIHRDYWPRCRPNTSSPRPPWTSNPTWTRSAWKRAWRSCVGGWRC